MPKNTRNIYSYLSRPALVGLVAVFATTPVTFVLAIIANPPNRYGAIAAACALVWASSALGYAALRALGILKERRLHYWSKEASSLVRPTSTFKTARKAMRFLLMYLTIVCIASASGLLYQDRLYFLSDWQFHAALAFAFLLTLSYVAMWLLFRGEFTSNQNKEQAKERLMFDSGADGLPLDDLPHRAVNEEDIASFHEAISRLSRFKCPLFIGDRTPEMRVFVVVFDDDGKNKRTDSHRLTVAARLYDALIEAQSDKFHAIYCPGVEWGREMDDPATFSDSDYQSCSLEMMYEALVQKATEWRGDTRDEEVAVLAIGSGSGAIMAAGFTRLVHRLGIQSSVRAPDGGENKNVGANDPIAMPESVPQAILALAPSNRSCDVSFERRISSSVVSGIQLVPMHEANEYCAQNLLWSPEQDEIDRFLTLFCAGSHSDVGGGNLRDGIERRCFNIAVDYCNAILGQAAGLRKLYLHENDKRMDVVHLSAAVGRAEIAMRVLAKWYRRYWPMASNWIFIPTAVALSTHAAFFVFLGGSLSSADTEGALIFISMPCVVGSVMVGSIRMMLALSHGGAKRTGKTARS